MWILHSVYLWNMYLFIFRIHYLFIDVFILLPEVQNVVFSGTEPNYLFIYVFILFPEVQKCYVFWHWARLFVYLCIYFISRSPEMLCFLALSQIICLFMYLFYFQKSRNVMFFRHCARTCKTGSSQWSVFETDITMSWINTNTVNKHFFTSSVTHRSTWRYIVDQIVWQWIE